MITNIKNESEYLVYLVACGYRGEKPQISPENYDMRKVLAYAKFHSVYTIAFQAIKDISNIEEILPPDLYKEWKELANKDMARDALFRNELKTISQKFKTEGIRMLILKGTILRDYYPKSYYRKMADMDIYVDKENTPKIKKIFTNMGYHCQSYGITHHDVYQKKPVFDIEIHRELFSEDNIKFYNYYKDTFNLCEPIDEDKCIYKFTPEDNIAYNIAHMYKHHTYSGTGIRSVLDIYVMNHNMLENLDQEKLWSILAQLDLKEYYQNMSKLAEYYFSKEPITNDDPINEDNEKETNTKKANENKCNTKEPLYSYDLDQSLAELSKETLESGTYGTIQKSQEKYFEKNGKLKGFIKRIFLPYSVMKKAYPILKTIPILLPIMWIVRWIERALSKESRRIFVEFMKQFITKKKIKE